MLVLTRKRDDRIRLQVTVDQLERLAEKARAEAQRGERSEDEGLVVDLVLVDVQADRARIGLKADKAVRIWRGELRQ